MIGIHKLLRFHTQLLQLCIRWRWTVCPRHAGVAFRLRLTKVSTYLLLPVKRIDPIILRGQAQTIKWSAIIFIHMFFIFTDDN